MINNLAEKVGVNRENNEKKEELRHKLAELQAKDGHPQQQPAEVQVTPSGQEIPQQQVVQQPQPEVPVQQPQEETAQPENHAQEGEAPKEGEFEKEFNQYAEKDPELALKDERVQNLMMQQIKELIEINKEMDKRIKETEAKMTGFEKEAERITISFNENQKRIATIDNRLEKFMGLYEIVTNRYNPFTEPDTQMMKNNSQPKRPVQQAPSAAPPPPPKTPAAPKKEKKPAIDPAGNSKPATATVSADMLDEIKNHLNRNFGIFENKMKDHVETVMNNKLNTVMQNFENVINSELRNEVKTILEEEGNTFNNAINEMFEESNQPVEEQESFSAEHVPTQEPATESLGGWHQKVDENALQLVDGSIVNNPKELRDKILSINPDIFSKHVTESRNDFADWLYFKQDNRPLAALIRPLQSKEEMYYVLNNEVRI